ncbi:MAG: MFS transporter, partial [Firmicutes bacterium]|nr:MFS transporter [Bacillota bacterium]
MLQDDHSLQNVLDGSRLSRLHWKVWFLSAMGVFLDGFDLFIIGVALPLIAHGMKTSPAELGLIGAAAPLGAMVGAFTLGRVTDKLGRKAMYVVDLLFFVVFAGLSALAWNAASLLLFRFLLGIGIGADYPISSTYVSELMPRRLRGRMLSSAFSFQALGALFGAGIGLLLLVGHPQADAWRYMLAAGIVPAVLVIALRTTAPESPRWQMEKGHVKEAAATARMLTGQEVSLPAENSLDAPLPYRTLFSGKYLSRTLLATLPWFFMDIGLYGISIFT